MNPTSFPGGSEASRRHCERPWGHMTNAIITKTEKNVNSWLGGDAYIGPAECTVFTELCGEFAAYKWADVGIGPYAGGTYHPCARFYTGST